MLQTMKTVRLLIFCLILVFGIPLFKTAQAAPSGPALSPELVACLKQQMGSDVFAQLSTGTTEPTADQAAKGEVCFKQFGSPAGKEVGNAPKREAPPQFSADTAACMKKALGDDYQQQILNATSESAGAALRSKAKSCFGTAPANADKVPDTVKQCMVNTIGQNDADKLFGGSRPDSSSDVYKKLDSAGCFKQFNHGMDDHGGSRAQNIPADKRQCIERIMGSITAEPTEDQKKEVGKQCFNGGEVGHSNDGEHASLPKAVEECLRGAMGDSFQTASPDSLSESDKQKASACFQKHQFQPPGAGQGSRPDLSSDAKSCIEKHLGKSLSGDVQIDDATKDSIGKECFKGVRPPGGSAPNISNQDRSACEAKISAEAGGTITDAVKTRILNECHGGGQDPNSGPQSESSKACADRVVAGIKDQLPQEEVQRKVNEACYASQNYGKPKVDDGTNHGAPPPGADAQPGTKPEDHPNDGGAYCAQNPDACKH